MYCSNCGKTVKEYDYFCKYCGKDLRAQDEDSGEELVLYVAGKHPAGVWLPLLWSPFLIAVFWQLYIRSSSIFGAIFAITFLVPVIYLILRHYSDSVVVTNKFVHLKHGAFDPEEIDVPLRNAGVLRVKQTSLGKILNYGYISFNNEGSRQHLRYIKNPEDLREIFADPEGFICGRDDTSHALAGER